MKLRRAIAVAAATAAIAPAALLAAPAAFATEGAGAATVSTSGSEGTPENPETDKPADKPADKPSEGEKPGDKPGEDAGKPGTEKPGEKPGAEKPGDKPGKPADETKPKPEPKPGDEDEEGDDEPVCETEPVELKLSITGLPGKIAAGSGWHKFKVNVFNPSKTTTVKNIAYFAGASADKDGVELFKTKKVELQAYNPDAKKWERLDEDGQAVGYVGESDALKPGYEVDIPLRVNVKANAPVGDGFTLGAGFALDEETGCVTAGGQTAYRFKIVKSGTDTEGTKPQEGGKTPIPNKKPAPGTNSNMTGNLAETGSSSALPAIGITGGVAVLAGAGVVFALKRRKGDATA
ncbi:LPXTG cell wall anchor domain-containing protein [Streptomyces sp. NPDC001941]|uniref:LPXTG cell wall anchor domain-containing protein n=1 Tax=Streptomyces sp. NPDC001941 TaxID=3154659 RepID=UPI00332FF39F